jgi:type 1 glutamine amidotransferase
VKYQLTENKMADAVFLGGDRFHKAEEAHAGIGPILEAAGLSAHYTNDFASINADLLDDANLLVFLRDGMEWPNRHDADPVRWMQPHEEESIEKFVIGGGSFLVMHNSAWNYPFQGGYRRTVAGYFQDHPPFQHFKVDITDRSHPITQGVESYEIDDEQHFIWFDKDRVDLFSVSQGYDGRQSASGYSHEYGEGRVAYLANGHRLSVLQQEPVQKLITNAVNCLLRG